MLAKAAVCSLVDVLHRMFACEQLLLCWATREERASDIDGAFEERFYLSCYIDIA